MRDGKTGALYRHGDPDALAARLKALSEEPARLAAIAGGAWEAASQHTCAYRAGAIRDLFDRSIAARRGGRGG